jgi:hypothetical protein
MNEPAAREFAEGLIRERLTELTRGRQVAGVAEREKEEEQSWEEVG